MKVHLDENDDIELLLKHLTPPKINMKNLKNDALVHRSGVKKNSIFPMSFLGQIPSFPFFPKSHGRNSKTRRISVGPCNKHSGDKRTNFRGGHPGGASGGMFERGPEVILLGCPAGT